MEEETGLSRFRRPEIKKSPRDVEPKDVSNGAIGELINLRYNPSADKIRELTYIDRMQGKILPLVDTLNSLRQYCMEIATFRQDAENYKFIYEKDQPDPPDIISELMYRIAQWQKSVDGRNMKTADDIILAQAETDMGADKEGFDAWGRD